MISERNKINDIRPSPTSMSTSKTLILQLSKYSIDHLGNQISVSLTSEDSLEDID